MFDILAAVEMCQLDTGERSIEGKTMGIFFSNFPDCVNNVQTKCVKLPGFCVIICVS